MEDPAGGKICSEAAARRPACRAGEIFLIRRVAGGGRGIQRFKSQQERFRATAARKGGDGRAHLGTRSAGQTPPVGHWASITRVRCAPGHVLRDALYRNGQRTVGICGPCEPDSGDLPKWAQDRTGIADRGRLSALFVPAQLMRDDGAQRRQVLLTAHTEAATSS